MLPFKIRFNKKINKSISSDDLPILLDSLKVLLKERGADYFFEENGILMFENKFFKLGWNWNLMVPVDSGSVELINITDKTITVSYSIKIVTIWVISLIFSLIIYFSTKELFTALIAFSFFGIFNWLIAILRHRVFLFTISEEIMKFKATDE